MHVREDKVKALMSAANNGMKTVASGTTAGEVYSAYLTMTRNVVALAKETGRDMGDIRNALLEMALMCDDQPGKVN